MSISKYAKHQTSNKKKYVITDPNGTVHQFDTEAQYLNSDIRKKALSDKQEFVALQNLKVKQDQNKYE